MDESERERQSSTRHADEPQQYGGQQLLNNPISYQPEYSQDHQHRQPYPSYGSNIVYNISQQPHNQHYGGVQSYPPRQNAAIEVLSSQFAGPSPYYVPGESPTPVGSGVPHQQNSSQFSSPSYGQYSPAAGRLSQPYAPSLPELAQPGASESVDDSEFAQQHHAAALDDAYNRYQTALKQTFQNMRGGRLVEAGASLLTISDWLLSNAVELGLVRDEQELHGDRTRLWNEFNTCWLSVLQKQKETIEEFIATGQAPAPPRDMLREEFLERMGRELVRLCDSMERHGLVDYQMGVWEEEILGAIQECLDLLEGTATSGAHPEGSSATAASRNPIRSGNQPPS
ncbi:hypothetical protein RUND412_008925 [Rhizina undulata]